MTHLQKLSKAKEKIEKITNLGDAPEEFACPECGKKWFGNFLKWKVYELF